MGLTLRYSTGLVTLNLSMVVMMMAGVVRKKSRMKRTTLMTRQRSHQMKPRMERCSLGGWRRHFGAGCLTRPQTPRTSVSSRAPLWALLAPRNHAGAIPLRSPVDVLGVGGVGHGPVGDVQGLAAGRGAGLPAARAALALTHVEVLQDAGGGGHGYQGPRAPAGPSGLGRAGGSHMAVMVSLWKVTKAMPSGFSFTFSFSRL